MKRTLSLTGITVNAMALIAPGAFLWTTFQVQASQMNGSSTTAFEMWTGLAAALILAYLTAFSYSELANRYPGAGAGSSYYFAEAAFLDKERRAHYQWARLAKFIFGWISHLYYWIYPGIMVAFSATLVVYVLGLFNVNLSVPGQIAVAAVFAAVNGYIAFRGISGSTAAAIVINVVQLVSLMAFSLLAVAYRLIHGEVQYEQANVFAIVIPHNLTNVIFQSTIAILLLVGFESVTALGAEARDPKRDIRRGVLLSLTIQGLFAYLFEYLAANFFVGNQLSGTVTDPSTQQAVSVTGYAAAAVSSAPIGDMMRVIGDTMLGGTGFTLTVILAGTVILALIGTTLACLNTAVRITYVMGRDREMPSILGLLHGRFATPHWGIVVLAAISAGFGAYGVLNVDNLTQITLASNTGTFLVYGLTNLIALIAFWSDGPSVVKHKLVPAAGLLANLAALGGVIFLSISAGGATQRDTLIALAIVAVWAVVGACWFALNTRRLGHPVLVEEKRRVPTAV